MTKQLAVVDVSSFTTDAKFRTWGLAMSTAMQACGLVLTSDTGQINWATVTKPVATNTQAGYEIYRFADSLQATAPVYIRIGYGSGGVASGNSPATWLTVGTGSNGSGTITGASVPAMQGYAANVTISNTTMQGMFTHTSDGYCLMAFGLGLTAGSTSSNAGIWVIDRTRNSTTAAATADGVAVYKIFDGTNSSIYGINHSTATAYTTARRPYSGLVSTVQSLATGTSIPLGKNYAGVPGLFPVMGLLTYYTTDIAQGSTFTATPFGSVARTYYALGNFGQGADPSGSTNAIAAVLWED